MINSAHWKFSADVCIHVSILCQFWEIEEKFPTSLGYKSGQNIVYLGYSVAVTHQKYLE